MALPVAIYNVKSVGYFFLADYGVESYNIGTGFGHFGIAVEDVSSKLVSLWTFSILFADVQFSVDAV